MTGLVALSGACASLTPPPPQGLATPLPPAAVDGQPIAYHVFGSGPVIIAHPGGPGGEWSYLRMPEVEKFATVVYVEPIGTGSSGRLRDPNGYTLEAYVQGIEAVRAALGVDRFVMLGHSHGGFVAQAYALTHPSHLRGLVLFDTSPVAGAELGTDIMSNLKWFENEPWFADASAAFTRFRAEKTDDDATAGVKRTMPFEFADWTGRSKELEPYRARARMWIAPRLSKPSVPGPFGTEETDFDVRPRLHEITAPTLILVGARDAICSQKMARIANVGIRGSRLVVLPHSGHMGHIEEPEAHAAAVHEFLAGLAA
jgi:proline iminopeptidase